MSSSKYNSSPRRSSSSSSGRSLHRHYVPRSTAAGAARRSTMAPPLLRVTTASLLLITVCTVVVVNGQDPLTSCPYILTQDGGDCVVAQRGCCPNSLVDGTCLDDGTDCPTTSFDCVWTSQTRRAVCYAYNITTDGESIVNYNEPRGFEASSSATRTSASRTIISSAVVVWITVTAIVAILFA